MKKLYKTFFMLLINSLIFAQTVDVLIENGRMDGSHYKYDIYLNRTSSWGEKSQSNYLGEASFRFTKNNVAFESSSLIAEVGTQFNNSSYTLTTQILQDQVNVEVDFDYQEIGSSLEMETKYLLCTVALTILDESQLASVSWIPLSTAVFNGDDENVYSTLLGNLEDEPIPVELTDFTAQTIEETKVRLNWQTATEVNNYGFDVERKVTSTSLSMSEGFLSRAESRKWKKIGFVEGHGNSYSPKHYSFDDNNIVGGSRFTYRLKQIDIDGTYKYSDEIYLVILPLQNKLFQNYPNPFNPTTKIMFALTEPQKIAIKIYNALGELVYLDASETFDAGFHEIEFNASNFASGVYFYRIQVYPTVSGASNFVDTKKMILLR
ncbi:MAG: T9SS type A sorting domain-containing protein [Bacteroidota bacterium]